MANSENQANMERIQNKVFWTIVVSEMGHVFCCVLPTVFSLISLFAGLGLVGALPAGYVEFHGLMHDWELTMVGFSGLLLAIGWALYVYSKKVNCHDTGCGHGPCAPKKDKSRFVLILATGLFFVNISIYAFVHQDIFGVFGSEETVSVESHHDHHQHHHH